jgi:methyl-accepting chemotaxis protein
VEAVLDRVDAVTARTEKIVAEIEATSTGAAAQVLAVGGIVATAEGLTARGERLVGRGEHLADQAEPVATAAVPLARRLLDELTEQEIHAIVTLVDRAPEVLEHVDETVVPTMQRMSEVGPDIKELLLAVSAMRELVESLPGMGRVRRRAAQKEREVPGGS